MLEACTLFMTASLGRSPMAPEATAKAAARRMKDEMTEKPRKANNA
jgi:hypothetical protein